MYHIAVLAPDKYIVKSEGMSMRLALERLRNNWNDHYNNKRPKGMVAVPTNGDFESDQFYHVFMLTDWIITTQQTAVELFIDTIADEAAGRE